MNTGQSRKSKETAHRRDFSILKAGLRWGCTCLGGPLPTGDMAHYQQVFLVRSDEALMPQREPTGLGWLVVSN